MDSVLLISDAAKKVNVEAHVLRYWEEELELPIKRNELGHRYYTEEDVRKLKEVKELKERGLQLKAIRMILKNGVKDILPSMDGVVSVAENAEASLPDLSTKGEELPMGPDILPTGPDVIPTVSDALPEGPDIPPMEPDVLPEEPDIPPMKPETLPMENSVENPLQDEIREAKMLRLQWLLKQLFRETMQENNIELCNEMRDSLVKEMDYQFRMQEEREDEREKERRRRDEDYYKKIDELLRKKRGL